MNLQDLENLLASTLDSDSDAAEQLAERIAHVQTFVEAGVLTSDKGLVITTRDGQQFQITLVQSR